MPAQHLKSFIHPRSIAVVGASRSANKIGHQVLVNLIDGGFKGSIYPVNPNAHHILNLKCFPTLHDIKKSLDLAIIATPASLVNTIVTECAQNKISNIIIMTTGFADTGVKGQLLQTELDQTIKKYSLNVLGPNSLGVFSPVNSLNASYGPSLPQKGSLMLASQSGALVTGIIDWATQAKIGLSHALTFGNRSGLSEIDAVELAGNDSQTKALLVYCESFHDASQFFSACSKLTPRKPIVLLTGGTLRSKQEHLVKSYARQTGVIYTDTMDSWLHIAQAFNCIPKAKSSRLTIVTNTGGPGVFSTDEVSETGLDMPDFSPKTRQKIQPLFPYLIPHNPLIVRGDTTPQDFTTILKNLKSDPMIHNLLVVLSPQTNTKVVQFAEAIVSSNIHKTIPTYTVIVGGDQAEPARELLDKHGLLHYDFPSAAIQTIAAKNAYESIKDDIPVFPSAKASYVHSTKIQTLIQDINKEVCLAKIFKLLNEYGIKMPKSAIVDRIEEVGEALNFVSRPCVAKTTSLTATHSTFQHIMTVLEARLIFKKLSVIHPQVLYQQTVVGEYEMKIQANRDEHFGLNLTLYLNNTSITIGAPTTKTYLKTLLRHSRLSTLQLDLVSDIIHRIISLMLDLPKIQQLELNPVVLSQKHIFALDAKITLVNHQ